ncbi:hypothetical protein [Thalassobius sp. MITS945101]|uniref:hypothetical protein n=1 Tax=Thalassobius sp. MITS945101 TaxID=3096994 RepID=UPI0039997203
MKRFGVGLSFFTGYAALSYALFVLLAGPLIGSRDAGVATIVLSFCVGLGFAAQLGFDWSFQRPVKAVLKTSYIATALFCVLLVVIEFETWVCVAMMLPVLAITLPLGIWLLRWLMSLAIAPPQFAVGLLALPLVLNLSGILPPTRVTDYAVQTTVIVDAPAHALRRQVQNVAPITEAEQIWTFTHSVLRAPRPVRAETKQGIRYAQWTQGVHFEEHLTTRDDPLRLDWEFHFPDLAAMQALDLRVSPVGPDVIMQGGGYSLRPLSDHHTEVTLTTYYQLNTPINGYLSLWGEAFLQDMHRAVLHVVKSRAEAA